MTAIYDDILDRDPELRPWIEAEYARWRAGLSSKRGFPAIFDDAWAKLDMKSRHSLYMGALKKKQFDEAQMATAEAGIETEAAGPRRKAKKTVRTRAADGSYTDVVVEIEEEQDLATGEWREAKPRRATPFEAKFKAAQARVAMAAAEEQLRDIEALERLRPEREELFGLRTEFEKRRAETLIGQMKRAELERKFVEPTKRLLIEPVQEAVVGGFRAMKATGYGRGSMKMAREAFVPDFEQRGYKEHPLRPAPRSRFTTPMVAEVPTRMPVRTLRSGKMIPAGEAIIAPAKMAKAAVIAPTVAGSLLRTSVETSPAAQALIPSRPARLGLSNLRVGIDTSGIRRGGALPKLKIKKNLYNEQLRKIRSLLR